MRRNNPRALSELAESAGSRAAPDGTPTERRDTKTAHETSWVLLGRVEGILRSKRLRGVLDLVLGSSPGGPRINDVSLRFIEFHKGVESWLHPYAVNHIRVELSPGRASTLRRVFWSLPPLKKIMPVFPWDLAHRSLLKQSPTDNHQESFPFLRTACLSKHDILAVPSSVPHALRRHPGRRV